MCIALFHSCIHLNCTLGQLFFQEATEETLMDDLTRGTGNQRPAPVGTLSLLKEWTWGWMGGGGLGRVSDEEKETRGGICRPDSAVT